MSKNVAVFVDVANIFYAAKAAGVDIDYVTLLKSAVSGRDFVRAYAYTGLDPENENQRQFHSFLARNGYKVVSKDIRKYGDGRIKANLDIELVVDLMRLARNLDIAVVVSGDGDFAPAIRAVQQMGVRVEVISFRGNTSSDLIEVADAFTDIAQIARVDKSSARSGRRVAAEGDLSMTAVPEKETEGVPRRQRGRRAERETAAVADVDAPANLIVLPGERLSRAPEDAELPEPEVADDEAGEPLLGREPGEGAEDVQRRRRRRGGRGRGRGRRTDVDVLAGGEPSSEPAEAPEDDADEDFDEVAPAQPAHHTFGSVWDSQLGVPSQPVSASGATYNGEEDEEDLEEPEIPEYLLAERRQRGQRGRVGGGRRAGYQAALDRERYGRGGMGGGFGGTRAPERPRQDRPRQDRPRQDRPRQGRPQQGRPQRQDRQAQPRQQERAPAQAGQPGGTPWSEVPPDLEEMLRAELARKLGGDERAADALTDADASAETAGQAAEEEKPKRTTRRRTTKAADADASAETAGQAAEDGQG